MWSYISATGGMIDAAVEAPQPGLVLRSPKLLFESLFGFLFPPRGNILLSFRKVGYTALTLAETAVASQTQFH
jgi:hypothetical protein